MRAIDETRSGRGTRARRTKVVEPSGPVAGAGAPIVQTRGGASVRVNRIAGASRPRRPCRRRRGRRRSFAAFEPGSFGGPRRSDAAARSGHGPPGIRRTARAPIARAARRIRDRPDVFQRSVQRLWKPPDPRPIPACSLRLRAAGCLSGNDAQHARGRGVSLPPHQQRGASSVRTINDACDTKRTSRTKAFRGGRNATAVTRRRRGWRRKPTKRIPPRPSPAPPRLRGCFPLVNPRVAARATSGSPSRSRPARTAGR